MKTYINITKYMSGDSLCKQVNEIMEAGKLDEDTRLFFAKGNLITMQDLAKLLTYFDIEVDWDFDKDNLVLRPRSNTLSYAENGMKLMF